MKNIFRKIITIIVAGVVLYAAFTAFYRHNMEVRVLKKIIARLEADSRIAEVLVTNVGYDEKNNKIVTTIKFLEYDSEGKPMEPKYFNFTGNIIQFQSLVIRFEDIHVVNNDKLKGKSAYLFWKVFALNGPETQEYDIAKVNEVPGGYKVSDKDESSYEKALWAKFWKYALDPSEGKRAGVKNAQIEAPGTMFVPGILYTIKIEHDGGMRIDAASLPEILKGESIPK
jgi:hypothetical protein